jgi:Ca-activated chloride channel homolog
MSHDTEALLAACERTAAPGDPPEAADLRPLVERLRRDLPQPPAVLSGDRVAAILASRPPVRRRPVLRLVMRLTAAAAAIVALTMLVLRPASSPARPTPSPEPVVGQRALESAALLDKVRSFVAEAEENDARAQKYDAIVISPTGMAPVPTSPPVTGGFSLLSLEDDGAQLTRAEDRAALGSDLKSKQPSAVSRNRSDAPKRAPALAREALLGPWHPDQQVVAVPAALASQWNAAAQQNRGENLAAGLLIQCRAVGAWTDFRRNAITMTPPTDDDGLDPGVARLVFPGQGYQDLAAEPVTTVALTADTATWEWAEAELAAGRRPDPTRIQVEHLLNSMPMQWPRGAARTAVDIASAGAPAPATWGPTGRTQVIALGLRGPTGTGYRPMQRRIIAVDASGSMARGGWERVRTALRGVAAAMQPGDRVALIAYRDQAELLVAPTDDGDAVQAAVAGLVPAGGTRAASALALASQVAAEEARGGSVEVVLITDGATLADGLAQAEEVARNLHRHGAILTIVGLGGPGYDGGLLDRVAIAGGGSHRLLPTDPAALASALVPSAQHLALQDAKLQITWNPARVEQVRVVGFYRRRLATQDFRNDAVAAGALASDQATNVLCAVVLRPDGSGALGRAVVRARDLATGQVVETAVDLPVSLLAPSPSLRLRALVQAADLGEVLAAAWPAHRRGLRAQAVADQNRALMAADLPADLRPMVERLGAAADRLARLEP